MEKYGNKSPFMKFVHKNTGYIVALGFAIAVILVYFDVSDNQEFFEKWTCPQIQIYLLTYNQEMSDGGFPDHEHLSDEQHDKIHEIVTQCDFKTFEHE